MSERGGSDIERLWNMISRSTQNLLKMASFEESFQSRSISDSPLSDIHFKNKMTFVRTTLKFFENHFLSLQSDHFFPDASKGKYALYRLYFCSLTPILLIGAKFKSSKFILECLLAKNESVSPVNYWKVDLPDVNFDDLS